MSGPLNRLPLGLLSLLELKSPAGRYPTLVEDAVRMQLDLIGFYRAEASVILDASTAVGGITTTNAFIPFTVGSAMNVPQGERWFLSEFSVEVPIQSDQQITVAPTLGLPGFIKHSFRLGDYVNAQQATIATRPVATAHYDLPRILPPGAQLGISVLSFTPGVSGSTTGIGRVRILRLTT